MSQCVLWSTSFEKFIVIKWSFRKPTDVTRIEWILLNFEAWLVSDVSVLFCVFLSRCLEPRLLPLYRESVVLFIFHLYIIFKNHEHDNCPYNLSALSDTSEENSSSRSSTSENYFTKQSTLNVQNKAFSRVGDKIWHEIPASLKSLSKNSLKKIIRTKLIEIPETKNSYTEVDTIINKMKDLKFQLK